MLLLCDEELWPCGAEDARATQSPPMKRLRALAGILSFSFASFAGEPVEAPLPTKDGPATRDGDLFQPFSALPDLSGDEVTPEIRKMIDDALAEPDFPDEPPAQPPDPKLLALAAQVASRVVALRTWDGYGEELARGCGFFVTADGEVLTDLSLVRPDFARRIEYITAATAQGARYRVTGFRYQDQRAGLVILQTDARHTPFIPLNTKADFSKELPVRIVALAEGRRLVMADAFARADRSQSGEGWLILHGADSPGEPGSPVINDQGEAIAIVSMRVPQKKWVNFGLSLASVAPALRAAMTGQPRPLNRLESARPGAIAQDARFVSAFGHLYEGNLRDAVRELLSLRRVFPRSAEVWALLGLACAKAGAEQEALNCNRKAVALDPDVGQYWYQLGLGYIGKTDARDSAAAGINNVECFP